MHPLLDSRPRLLLELAMLFYILRANVSVLHPQYCIRLFVASVVDPTRVQ
jgi:hypothetical protein